MAALFPIAHATRLAAQPPPYVGVATSRSMPSRMVVWTESRVFRSGDGGATREPVALAGEGTVEQVALDDDGSLAVLRVVAERTFVDRIDASGATVTIERPWIRAVASGGGRFAMLLDDRIEVWGRSGAAIELPLPPACGGCEPTIGTAFDLAMDARGVVHLADVEINTCGSSDLLLWQRVLRVTTGSRFEQAALAPGTRDEYVAGFSFGAFGWIYGVTYAGRFVAVRPGGTRAVVGLPRTTPAASPQVADNGRVTLVVHDGWLARVDGARARLLDRSAPSAAALAVDDRGRALVVTEEGALVRWSRYDGWSSVPLDDRP